MFREMRRKDRSIDRKEIERILAIGEYGLLATTGKDNYPYVIPYSYAWSNGKIYIHSTNQISHNRDNINCNPKVCFTVVGETELMPDKFATCYESVVVFGTAKEVTELELKKNALMGLVRKYSTGFQAEGQVYIEKMLGATIVLEITPEHATGKARRKAGKSNLEFLHKD